MRNEANRQKWQVHFGHNFSANMAFITSLYGVSVESVTNFLSLKVRIVIGLHIFLLILPTLDYASGFKVA